MAAYRGAFTGVLALALVLAAFQPSRADEKKPAKAGTGTSDEAVFKMQELSIFDAAEKVRDEPFLPGLFGWTIAACSKTPAKEVKAYPKLNSKQPLYGTVVFGRDPTEDDEAPGRAASGPRYHFVLDESGTAEKPAKPAAEKAATKPAAPPKAGKTGASDAKQEKRRSAKKKKAAPDKPRYDRLYFDANGDLDLTNDPVVLPRKAPLGKAFEGVGDGDHRPFDLVSVTLRGDPNALPFRILPIVPVIAGRVDYILFLSASARQGDIRIGKRAFRAILAQPPGLSGRFDRPSTVLHLTPIDGPKTRWDRSSEPLGGLRAVDDEYYTISASPSGDRLTVKRYAGDCGIFEVRPPSPAVKKVGAVGVFRSKDGMLPVGQMSYPLPGEKRPKYRLPVGDYQPYLLRVDVGTIEVQLQMPRDSEPTKAPAYPIAIRKDKPYLLDFSGKPTVKFLTPARDAAFRPGDTIRLVAMLVDGKTGLAIGDLVDTTKKTGEFKYQDEKGETVTVPRYASLDPTVVITSSSGRKVAQGKMPFG